MNISPTNYGATNYNSQVEYLAYPQDDIRNYSHALKKTKGKDKYECPVCGGNDLSVSSSNGKFTCYNHSCNPKEIFEAAKKLAGEWVEHSTRSSRSKTVRKKGNAKKQLQPVPININNLEIATLPQPSTDVFLLPESEIIPDDVIYELNKKASEDGTERRTIKAYEYCYEDTHIFTAYKCSGINGNVYKTFRWCHSEPETFDLMPKKGDIQPRPYQWEEVLEYGKNQAVVAVEGEKDVETLRSQKIVATNIRCLTQQPEYLESLKEKNSTLIIIPDNDEAGKNQADKLEGLCREHQVSYIKLNLPELWADCPEKGDITDYLEANPMAIPAFIEQLEREIHMAVAARNDTSSQTTATATVEPERIELTNLNKAELVKFIEQNFSSLRVNERSLKVELEGKPISLETFHIQLAKKHRVEASKQNVIDTLGYIATQDSYDPVKLELEAIATDIEPVDIDEVLKLILGDLKPIELVFVKKWLIAAVARVLEPGCEAHTVLTLIGQQGIGKTTFFKILGSSYFDSSLTGKLDKDDLMKLYGAWIQVLDEIDTFITGKRDSAINAFVTANKDTFRVPYDRETTGHRRRSVFAATGNNPQFLQDPNGNRRFWVVNLEGRKINLHLLTEKRDAILSWAIQAYRNNEQWWLTEEEEKLNRDNNEQYRDADEWEAIIQHYITEREKVGVNEILKECFEYQTGKMDKSSQMRVGKILKSLDWKKKGFYKYEGKRCKCWVRCSTSTKK